MTEASIILGSLEALFAFFVGIQFRYFFGGQVNISAKGFTYAEYARRGFGELVAVEVFSLLLWLGLSTITRRETRAKRMGFSAMGTVLVGLVLVMLVSAFQRLQLYEAAYGFTRLRTYTHVFMVWLGLLLLAVVLLEWIERQRLVALAAVFTALGFVTALNGLNVDAFIVRQNVKRAHQGSPLDVIYLASLSTDAVPALAQAYLGDDLSAEQRRALGAQLVCQAERLKRAQPLPWPSFHLSRNRAQAVLVDLHSELASLSCPRLLR
jgi:hypothetical protein